MAGQGEAKGVKGWVVVLVLNRGWGLGVGAGLGQLEGPEVKPRAACITLWCSKAGVVSVYTGIVNCHGNYERKRGRHGTCKRTIIGYDYNNSRVVMTNGCNNTCCLVIYATTYHYDDEYSA